MNQAIRAELLARNEHVDAVVIFEEDTPTEAISVIDPSILIKGPEYHDEEVPGASIVQERGGTVMFLPRESEVKLVRTSIIVDRIRNGEHEP
jgi:D-beta-D-heptose 7-phosphate kinase/D-beta-D-heptose 1-phosphate adenosyltransferase